MLLSALVVFMFLPAYLFSPFEVTYIDVTYIWFLVFTAPWTLNIKLSAFSTLFLKCNDRCTHV